jgi:TrmH family RNA methyltransferase
LAQEQDGKPGRSPEKQRVNIENWPAAAAMLQRTKTTKGRRSCGLFSVYGTRMVKRALQAGMPIALVLHAADYGRHPPAAALLTELHVAGCPLLTAPPAEMAALTAGRVQGAIAALLPLPAPPDLTAHLQQTRQPLLLVAVDVQDPGNLGALTRTAHAAGADMLITSGPGDPFHPEAVRTSLGSIFKLPVLHQSWEKVLPTLQAYDIELVATVADAGSPLPAHHFAAGGTALFLGSEHAGLPPSLTAQIAHRLTIPMPPGVDSFSVNAAAAIFLYELQRQRRDRH